MSEDVSEAIGSVSDTFDIFLGAIEDYLKHFKVPQSDIDKFKQFTPFRAPLYDAAELLFASGVSTEKVVSVATGIAADASYGGRSRSENGYEEK